MSNIESFENYAVKDLPVNVLLEIALSKTDEFLDKAEFDKLLAVKSMANAIGDIAVEKIEARRNIPRR